MLHSSGITIEPNFIQVEARVLQAPRVCVYYALYLIQFALFDSNFWLFKTLLSADFICYALFLQLTVGDGLIFFPRNGRWNFNDKVTLVILII